MSIKKLPMLLIISLACFNQNVNAKIWRVNGQSNYNGTTLWGSNFGGTATYPVFAKIDSAVSIAVNGDTIHVEGSPGIYSTGTITKRLVIIGSGYFVTENPKTSVNTLETKISHLIFDDGSEGSIVMGCYIIASNLGAPAGRIDILADGITIKRCRIELGLVVHNGLNDLYILENFFELSTSGSSTVGILSIVSAGTFVPPSGLIFNNNICQGALWWGAPNVNPTTLYPIAKCNNNVFDGKDNLVSPTLAFSTSEFKNNILIADNAKVNIAASGGAGSIAYNVGTLPTQFGTADNNLVIPAITSLFISSTSTDGAYQIADGTAADNSGSDGTDRGVFGGPVVSRYTLSGLVPVPVIYQISASGVSDASGLPVTIRARTIQ